MIDLSLILPVRNEEEIVEGVVGEIRDVLVHQDFSWEIILVENGSTDRSMEAISRLEERYPEVVMARSPAGYGNAVREGFRHASGRFIAYMVSDGQIDPHVIPELLRIVDEAGFDLAKAYRTLRESRLRRFVSRTYNAIAGALFSVSSRDINASPKLFRKELIEKLDLRSTDSFIDLELMSLLLRGGGRFTEIPITNRQRAGGKSLINIGTVFEFLGNMCRNYRRLRRKEP